MKRLVILEKSQFDSTQHNTRRKSSVIDEKSLAVSFFVKKAESPKPKFRTTSFSQEEKRKQNLFFSLLVLYDNQHPFCLVLLYERLVRHQNHIK